MSTARLIRLSACALLFLSTAGCRQAPEPAPAAAPKPAAPRLSPAPMASPLASQAACAAACQHVAELARAAESAPITELPSTPPTFPNAAKDLAMCQSVCVRLTPARVAACVAAAKDKAAVADCAKSATASASNK